MVSSQSHSGLDRAELVMLAGACVAPFNFFVEFHIGGLPLLLWAFIAALVVIALYRREIIAAIDGPMLALWGMFLFILLSTALATPAEYRSYGIADVVVLSLNLAAFSVIRCYYFMRPEGWDRFFTVLAISSVCMSLGLITRALMIASTGLVTGVDSYALGLGTVAGTYTAAFTAAAAAAALFATSRRGFALALGAYLVHGVAGLLSLARGPWLAFVVASLTVIPIAAWRFRGRITILTILMRTGSLLVALPTVTYILLVVSPLVRELVAQRFFGLVQLDAGTGWSRLVMWQAFLRDAERSPVFGHGASAYREIAEQMGVPGTVSENFVIEILHAGGGVAVLLLLVGLIGILLYCLLQPGAGRRPAQTAACLTGAATLMMGSTTNPAAWNPLFWVLLGVVASRPLGDEDLAPAPAYSMHRNIPVVPTRDAVVPSAGG